MVNAWEEEKVLPDHATLIQLDHHNTKTYHINFGIKSPEEKKSLWLHFISKEDKKKWSISTINIHKIAETVREIKHFLC